MKSNDQSTPATDDAQETARQEFADRRAGLDVRLNDTESAVAGPTVNTSRAGDHDAPFHPERRTWQLSLRVAIAFTNAACFYKLIPSWPEDQVSDRTFSVLAWATYPVFTLVIDSPSTAAQVMRAARYQFVALVFVSINLLIVSNILGGPNGQVSSTWTYIVFWASLAFTFTGCLFMDDYLSPNNITGAGRERLRTALQMIWLHYLGIYNYRACESATGQCALDLKDGVVLLYFLALWAGCTVLTLLVYLIPPSFSSLRTARAGVQQAARLVSRVTWAGFEMMLTTDDHTRMQHWVRLNTDVAATQRKLGTIKPEIEMSYWECYDLFGTGPERRRMALLVDCCEAICIVLSSFCVDSWQKLDNCRGGDAMDNDWKPVCHLLRAVENALQEGYCSHLSADLVDALQTSILNLDAMMKDHDFSADIIEALEINNDDALVRLVVASRAQYIGNAVTQLLSDLHVVQPEPLTVPARLWAGLCSFLSSLLERCRHFRSHFRTLWPIMAGNMVCFLLTIFVFDGCDPSTYLCSSHVYTDGKPHYDYSTGINVALLLSLKRRLKKDTINLSIQRVYACAVPLVISRLIIDRTSDIFQDCGAQRAVITLAYFGLTAFCFFAMNLPGSLVGYPCAIALCLFGFDVPVRDCDFVHGVTEITEAAFNLTSILSVILVFFVIEAIARMNPYDIVTTQIESVGECVDTCLANLFHGRPIREAAAEMRANFSEVHEFLNDTVLCKMLPEYHADTSRRDLMSCLEIVVDSFSKLERRWSALDPLNTVDSELIWGVVLKDPCFKKTYSWIRDLVANWRSRTLLQMHIWNEVSTGNLTIREQWVRDCLDRYILERHDEVIDLLRRWHVNACPKSENHFKSRAVKWDAALIEERCSALWVAGVAAIAKLVQDEGEVKSYQEQYECVEQLSLLCGLLRTTLHLLFRMHTRVEIMRNGIFYEYL